MLTLMSGKECNDLNLTKTGKKFNQKELIITFNILVIIRFSLLFSSFLPYFHIISICHFKIYFGQFHATNWKFPGLRAIENRLLKICTCCVFVSIGRRNLIGNFFAKIFTLEKRRKQYLFPPTRPDHLN